MVMESIRQLREICQHTRDDKFFQSDWLDRNLLRRASIYLTRFFLKAGLSSNKVTLLSLLPAIVAGALLTLPQTGYWLLAWGLILIFEILDCCDGEIARYQKSATVVGEYNDIISYVCFSYPFLRVCMCFGIYQALGNTIIFVFGFALVIGWTIYWFSPILCEFFLGRKGILQVELERTEQMETPKMLSGRIARYGKMLFGHTGFFFTLPVISLSDMFIPPLTVGSLGLNMRFIYVALLALVMVFSALLRVYDINKHGVRLHK